MVEYIDLMNVMESKYQVNEEEECMICKVPLKEQECYTLPECHHKFHTNCIVTWFRCGDGRCPYCGDRGINHDDNKSSKFRYHRRNRNGIITNPVLTEIIKYIKKNEVPVFMEKMLERYENMKEDYINIKREQNEYRKSLKEVEVKYFDVKKKINYYRSRIWEKRCQYIRVCDELMMLPIHKIIIPAPVLLY